MRILTAGGASPGTPNGWINSYSPTAGQWGVGVSDSSAKWTEFLSVGNAKVGMRSIQIASETLTRRYFQTDHLGSISVITNENGVVVERLSYDALGQAPQP